MQNSRRISHDATDDRQSRNSEPAKLRCTNFSVLSSALSPCPMRQQDYALHRCIARRRRWQQLARLAQAMEVSESFVIRALENAEHEHDNVIRLQSRTREVQNVSINLNTLSDLQLATDFRFRLPEISKIADKLGWRGVTSGNTYRCELVLGCA